MKGFLTGRVLSTTLLGLASLGLWSCVGSPGNQNGSPVILEITEIEGVNENGGTAGTPSSVLLSDVLFKGSVFNDNALIFVQVIPKNQTAGLTLGNLDAVFLDSYSVVYTRTDGQNQQGVDVPYAFTGPMSFQIPANASGGQPAQVSIIVVRHQAKSEPPLSLLDGGGQNGVITTIATITIYGHTLGGQVVTATGSLEVVFADFGDTTG